MTRVRIGVTESSQAADDQGVAISVPVEPRSGRESEEDRQKSRGQPGMQRDRPVGKAQDVAQTSRHAGHASAGRLPEALNEQLDALAPPDWHHAGSMGQSENRGRSFNSPARTELQGLNNLRRVWPQKTKKWEK